MAGESEGGVQIGRVAAPGTVEEKALKGKRAGSEGNSFAQTTVPDKKVHDKSGLPKKDFPEPFPLRRKFDNSNRTSKADLTGVDLDANSGVPETVFGKGQNQKDTSDPADFSGNNAASVNKK